MWKPAVCVIALVILTVATNAIQAKPTCYAVFTQCNFWGADVGQERGSPSQEYSGYLCNPKDHQTSRTATPQPGQTIQAIDLPDYENCGLLYTYTYDPITQTATDLVNVPGPGCGGNQATGNCDEPPSA